MAILQKIIVSDFRNIKFAELSFSSGLNCICGDNGQGKTNLLDAIYYLSMTKSAFGTPDQFCRRHGCAGFSISGTYLMEDGLSSKYVLNVQDSGKLLKKDGKILSSMSLHIGRLPVVMVSPQDSALVSDGGESRRRFMNAVLSQMDREYLAAMQKYNRLLVQRNRLLKEPEPDFQLMEALDMGMEQPAAYISEKRAGFARNLSEAVRNYYMELSGGRESVSVEYQGDMSALGEGEGFMDMLIQARNRDRMLKYTSVGVQRDDLVFLMDGHGIRKCGSQGQQKSFLVALKLAQYDIMKEACGFAPILLLDDVFDKLDLSRISRLIGLVSDNAYGQIFISDTNRSRLEEIIRNISPDAKYFDACDGEFQGS